ncbi:GntR family transcriptional regulator [Streptomyces xanthochromogenes]|uniref:GntR family transcriptional regulator n=1 Tax=Streptomyces xanthochromogenes TaxID=67384 RepID=UPI003790F8A9
MATNRYTHIADDIRRRITTGSLSAGDQLPSETMLARQYSASHVTVREAIQALENEGLILRKHGRGNFVRHTFGRIAYFADYASADTWAADNIAVEVSVRSGEVESGPRLASLLRLPLETLLTEYVYLGHHRGAPCTLARVYVPCDVAKLDAPLASPTTPLGEDIRVRLAEVGVEVTRTVSRVTSRLPDAEEAWTLRIGTGTAVLTIERISVDASGRVVEAALLVLPGHSSEAIYESPAPARDLEATA